MISIMVGALGTIAKGLVKGPEDLEIYFFCWLSIGLLVWPGLGDLFVSQNAKEFYATLSPGQILVCAYITVSSNLNFFHNSQSFLFLCSFFCVRLLRSLIYRSN